MKEAVFLDRDGVINRKPPEHEYVGRWEQFELLPSVIEAIRCLNERGYLVVVISNQQGVGLGRMKATEIENIHAKLAEVLLGHGVTIDRFYWCGHSENANCDCRKPKPGLIYRAKEELGINLERSYFIGDSESDRQCGAMAGVKTIIVGEGMSLLGAVKLIIGE